jgi:predicted nucleic acid-binding Zn ribbon protein
LRQNNVNNYSPYDYLKLIYYDDKYEYPLSIYDPTLIIKKLIDALDSLWEYRNEIEMQDFISFKYTEKGILKAKPSMSRKWYTLLAYCGNNYIEGKGPCGFKPLIKGKHSTCDICGYIICPECNFCKKECKGISDRKITKERNFNKAFYND